MKAENVTTGHNRTIRLTEIPGDELKTLLITITYVEVTNDGGVIYKAVTLDNVVIPLIMAAINERGPGPLNRGGEAAH